MLLGPQRAGQGTPGIGLSEQPPGLSGPQVRGPQSEQREGGHRACPTVWRDSSDSALEREGPAPESSGRRGDGLSQRPELQKGGVLRGTRPGLPRLANWEGVTGNQNRLWVWCSGPRLPAAPQPSSARCGWLFPRGETLALCWLPDLA